MYLPLAFAHILPSHTLPKRYVRRQGLYIVEPVAQ